LIECHAWLLTWFLGLILLVSGLEVAGAGSGSRLTGVSLLLGGWLLRCSVGSIPIAAGCCQHLGQQAVCPACSAYTEFNVFRLVSATSDGGDPVLEIVAEGLAAAQCRRCGDFGRSLKSHLRKHGPAAVGGATSISS
jgi:hypothetical protein